jgi:uncharacterized SAM-binding protein YcdF (DUF218 family)
MLFLHKLLPLIVSPLGLVSFLLLISILIRRRGPAAVGLLLLLVSALPLTGDRLWEALEADYPYRPIESVENADAVVVLSGMLGGIETSDGVVPQWGEATDRFFAGIDLLTAEKAPLIIFTRGQYPWDSLPPEGEQLANRAIAMGVPERQILLTGTVTNTADEAGEVKSLMDFGGMKRVILVTSSFHMPRAKMLFDRAGVDSIPYPTDFRSKNRSLTWESFVPKAGALAATSKALREYLGRGYYTLSYWVSGSEI